MLSFLERGEVRFGVTLIRSKWKIDFAIVIMYQDLLDGHRCHAIIIMVDATSNTFTSLGASSYMRGV